MAQISRSRLARHVVDTLQAGNNVSGTLRRVAAYIVEERRESEVELIIREILDEYESRGIVVAEVTTAHELDSALRRQITTMIGGERVELVEHIDPDVLGGVRITTPSRQLDSTTRRRLTLLRESK